MSYTTYTRTHGTNSTYVQGCRCVECREAARQYLKQYRRQKTQAPTPVSLIPDTEPPVERRVTGISGMTTGSILTSTGVKVWCRCGASDYANKWIVGKSRKIDHCRECQ